MRIALIGYGKMGQAIEKIAVDKGHEIVLKIDISNPGDFNRDNLAKADVAIEFTGPHSAFENVIRCIDSGIPVVSGSTGWLDKWEEVKKYCFEKDGTLVYASNYSIGVNLFFELNTYLAKLMDGHTSYDVMMEEIHHTQKKDAPSGTAITLAEQIMANMRTKKQWVNDAELQPGDLLITSKRIDPAPGTHKVTYRSPVDDIEIIHTAHNRTGFGAGAVMAAEFTAGRKGVFGMKEVLGL